MEGLGDNTGAVSQEKYYPPGQDPEGNYQTLAGPLIVERREFWTALMSLCEGAVCLPLEDCPNIESGKCPAVRSLRTGEEFTGCSGTEGRRKTRQSRLDWDRGRPMQF